MNVPDVSVLNNQQEITEITKVRRDDSTDSDPASSRKSSLAKLLETGEKSKQRQRGQNDLERLIYKEL